MCKLTPEDHKIQIINVSAQCLGEMYLLEPVARETYLKEFCVNFPQLIDFFMTFEFDGDWFAVIADNICASSHEDNSLTLYIFQQGY